MAFRADVPGSFSVDTRCGPECFSFFEMLCAIVFLALIAFESDSFFDHGVSVKRNFCFAHLALVCHELPYALRAFKVICICSVGF